MSRLLPSLCIYKIVSHISIYAYLYLYSCLKVVTLVLVLFPFIIKCVHGLERDVKAFVFRTVQMSSGCLATFVVYASRLELVIVLH